MTYVATVNLPGAPKKAIVQIPGLATFENGVSQEIEDDVVKHFVYYQNTASPNEVVTENDDGLTYESLERDLDTVVKNAQYLTISKKGTDKKEGDK